MFHATLDRQPWGPCADLARLDAALVAAGSVPLRLDVGAYELEADGDHYTRAAHRRFCADLAAELRPFSHPLVIADSTIDHHNRTAEGEWTGWASRTLVEALGGRGVVDAVCGSGFVARADRNEHFYVRLAYHLRCRAPPDAVVFVGGWNDARAGRARDACASARACVALAARRARQSVP